MKGAMISRTGLAAWVLVGVFFCLQQGTSNAYSPPNRFGIQQQQSYEYLLASRDALRGPATEPPLSRTTTTISKLPSFQDEDPRMAWLARIRTVVQPVSLLISMSLLVAVGLVAWEDYGAVNLWPNRHMIVITSNNKDRSSVEDFGSRTIHGLGFGRSQRLRILQEDTSMFAGSLLPEIRSYNEVLEEHRLERVTRWQQNPQPTTSKVEASVADLQHVLLQVLQLQTLVADYQWEQVHSTITSITPKLEPAATVIRRYLTAQLASKEHPPMKGFNIAYEEVGFDWGSCAWRHCGALADAQEALDELDYLLGVLEPPECLFCLNVVERSIREILAVVPAEFQATAGLPAYKPYQSLHVPDETGEFGEETDILDIEYLKMLQELRSSSTAEEEG
jgi:hypothetical protein